MRASCQETVSFIGDLKKARLLEGKSESELGWVEWWDT
jgi:hypothetical protein